MRETSTVGRFLLLAATVTGCARAPVVPPPTAQEVKLVGMSAPLREYGAAKADICKIDRVVAWQDANAMNELLSAFVAKATPPEGGTWTDEQITLIKDAEGRLNPVLAVYEANTTALASCRTDRKADVREVTAQGLELVEKTRAVLRDAPKVLAETKRKKALEDWKAAEITAQGSEKQNWCPPKPKGIPDVYYAWQDETGKIEWFFCDGAKVVVEPGGEPQLVPPADDPKPKPPAIVQGYIKTSKKFPDSEIRRPPTGNEAAPTPTAGEPATGGGG